MEQEGDQYTITPIMVIYGEILKMKDFQLSMIRKVSSRWPITDPTETGTINYIKTCSAIKQQEFIYADRLFV